VVSWLAGAHDPLQRASAADIATWLADDLLVKVDRMTMAHSLEGRAPYLHPGLVELAVNLPQTERMSRANSKVALRRVAGKYLPSDIVSRRKQGFVLPMRTWLEAWFKANDPPIYFSTCTFPGLDAPLLTELVVSDLSGGLRRERLLFSILMLLEWWNSFRSKRNHLIATLHLPPTPRRSQTIDQAPDKVDLRSRTGVHHGR
jgi:asparagine synthase (glutamine-hydrolysing)